MIGDARHDDDSVGLVNKGLVVGVGLRGAAADGRGGHRGASSGIDQGLDLGGVLEKQHVVGQPRSVSKSKFYY